MDIRLTGRNKGASEYRGKRDDPRYVDLRSIAAARLAPFLDGSTGTLLPSLFSSFLTTVHSTTALIIPIT